MSINFAQTGFEAADLVDNSLPIIRGKMMAHMDIFDRIVRHERFERILNALEAAERHDLHRTANLHRARLLEMGCWLDDVGDWHEDTRPIKPIDDEPGADLSAGWEY